MSRGLKISTDPSQWGFKGKNYLFTIGIDTYEHWKPLNNAVKDVDDITEILTSRYQFEEDNIRNLRNEEATEDGNRDELVKVKRVITEKDNLVVCFSGHGYYDEDWKRACNINSKSSLAEYLESHPSGGQYDEVRKMLEDLEEQSCWQQAKSKGTISGIQVSSAEVTSFNNNEVVWVSRISEFDDPVKFIFRK